ncbi:hypothetical protein FS837_011250 [Tulasnella sp. UAMH 9824]|nr:hypothetical protein FS837_011250 [Tulasnella sp. UAMH 9824]
MSKDKETTETRQSALSSTGDAVLDFLMAQDPSASAVSSNQPPPGSGGVQKGETATTLSAHMTKLELLISGSVGDDENLSDDDVMELLRQLEEADGIASGLEDKLDGLLENLEGMLKGLERPQGNDERMNKEREKGSDG